MTSEPTEGFLLLAEADALASEAHADQVRSYSGRPYVDHPRAVADLLREAGFGDDVLAAALLHDVVEVTPTGADQIRERFGDGVADLVGALTEDPSIQPYERRKDAHRDQVISAGPEAIAVYAADKLSNVRDLRRLYEAEGEAVAGRLNAPLELRIALWRRDVEGLSPLRPRPPFVAELSRELEALTKARSVAIHKT